MAGQPVCQMEAETVADDMLTSFCHLGDFVIQFSFTKKAFYSEVFVCFEGGEGGKFREAQCVFENEVLKTVGCCRDLLVSWFVRFLGPFVLMIF